MKPIFIILLSLFGLNSFAASVSQRADSAYNCQQYPDAISLYRQSIAEDGPSATTYYNLGNAYFRNNNLGKAIIAYERCLALDPSNSDARANLDFVRTRIDDAPEDDSSFLSNLHHSVKALFAPNAWASLALAVFILLLGSVALYLFARSVSLRKTGFFAALVMAAVFVYTIIIAWQTAAASRNHDFAVVIVPTTNLTSAPQSNRGEKEKTVPIHEGTKVEIIDSLSTPHDPNVAKWYDVKINNSSRAWVNAGDVERI